MPRRKDVGGTHNEREFKKWDGRLDLGTKHQRSKGLFIFLFGKRGTGKSMLHMHLLKKNADQFYAGIAMSKVQPSVQGFEECFPKSLVYDTQDDAAMERAAELAKTFSRNKDWPMDDIIINVDDGSTKKNALNSNVLTLLAMQGRHLSCSVIIAVQYFKAVKPDIRGNANLMLLGRCPSAAGKKGLWDEFFKGNGIFSTEDEFCIIMDQLTSNYKFMVVDQDASGGLENMLKTVKADKDALETEPFRVGHRDIWLLDHMKRVRTKQNDIHTIFNNLAGREPEVDLDDGFSSDDDHCHHGGADDMDVVCVECIRAATRNKLDVDGDESARKCAARTRRELRRDAEAKMAKEMPSISETISDSRGRLPNIPSEALQMTRMTGF